MKANFENSTLKNYVEPYFYKGTAVIFYPKVNSNKSREIMTAVGAKKIESPHQFKDVYRVSIILRNHFDRILSTYYDKICSDYHYVGGVKSMSGVIGQFGERGTFKEFFDRIMAGVTRDEHILPYSILHQATKFFSVKDLRENFDTRCFLTSEFTDAFDFAGIEKEVYQDILAVKTNHSSVYVKSDSVSDMIIDKPYDRNYTAWEIGNARYRADLMYDDIMISQVKEKYKRDTEFDSRVLEFKK